MIEYICGVGSYARKADPLVGLPADTHNQGCCRGSVMEIQDKYPVFDFDLKKIRSYLFSNKCQDYMSGKKYLDIAEKKARRWERTLLFDENEDKFYETVLNNWPRIWEASSNCMKHTYRVDLSNIDDVKKTIEQAKKEYHRLNAGDSLRTFYIAFGIFINKICSEIDDLRQELKYLIDTEQIVRKKTDLHTKMILYTQLIEWIGSPGTIIRVLGELQKKRMNLIGNKDISNIIGHFELKGQTRGPAEPIEWCGPLWLLGMLFEAWYVRKWIPINIKERKYIYAKKHFVQTFEKKTKGPIDNKIMSKEFLKKDSKKKEQAMNNFIEKFPKNS